MDLVNITFNNGITMDFPKGTTYYEISKNVTLKNKILGVKVNNTVLSLTKSPTKNEKIEFFDVSDLNGYMMYKSGLKMIFELALKRIYPSAEIHFNHSVPKGMLGTIIDDKLLTDNDILKLKTEMHNIVNQNIEFKKLYVRKKEAIMYYEKIHCFEKEENIRNIMDGSVTLYSLDNLLNYYYCDMPYSTSSIDKFELINLGNNKIVFLFPNMRSNGETPEYSPSEKIVNTFMEGQSWLEKLNMPYVTDLNKIIGNGKIKDFINSTEIMFNLSVANLAQTILKDPNKKVLLIAGPSSSGKTTTEKRIAAYLEAMGFDPIRFSMDDYFLNREDTPKDAAGNLNFECPESVDINLLNQNVMDLINDKEVHLSVFNFYTGKRELTDKVVKMHKNSIILIEGLHALNDLVVPNIPEEQKYKVYLSPFIPLSIDRHNYISTVDLRLMRRIVRDNRTRGYDVGSTIKSWQIVRDGEEKYIFSNIPKANLIINTALAYEIGVLKVYLEPLLYSVGIESVYYEEAQRLLKSLKQFFTIPSEYISKDSILREFIGGNDND